MLELKNIHKKYKDRVVIDDISMVFPDNGLFFIIGDSGAGKTTLLNIIGMLDCNYSGKVILDERVLNSTDRKKVQEYHRKQSGFIFQDYNLLDYLTVEENIKLPSTLAKEKIDNQNYKEIIEHLKLQKVEKNLARDLSGGEKQRVSIARILCRDNNIILADEPTGNLDRKNSKIIFETLRQLSKEKLIIVVTHNEDAANEYGDCVIRISDGEIVEQNQHKNIEKSVSTIPCKMDDILNKNIRGLLQLTAKYLKFNRKKVISATIVMIFCVTAIALFLSVYMSINDITGTINKSILDNDKLTIIDNENNNTTRYNQISEQFMKDIEGEENVVYSLPYYEETVILTSTDNGERIFGEYNVVEDASIFENRYDDLEGRMPKKKDEILITKTIAQTIFPDGDGVGRRITLTTMGDQEYTCTIVGYRKSSNQYDKGIYITKKLADEISSNLLQMEYQAFSYVEEKRYNGVNAVKIKNNDADGTNEYKIIYGRDIKNKNEVILEITGVNEYLSYMRVKKEYTLKELLNGDIEQEHLKLIFDNEICLSGTIENTRLADVHVVGIYAGKDEETDITFWINDALIRELSKPIYNSIDIYVHSLNKEKMKSVYELIEKYGYFYSSIAGDMGGNISIKLSMIFSLLTVVMIFIIIVTVIMIHYATKVILNDRVYEIGVLKSLGMNNGSVLMLFFLQNSFIGIISGIFSCVLVAGCVKLNIFRYENIPIVEFNGAVCFLAVLVGLLICNLSGISEMLKLSKKSVMECIRN